MKIQDLLQERLGLTKSEFCRKANISRPTLDTILRGEQVSLSTIKKICKYFGIDYRNYI